MGGGKRKEERGKRKEERGKRKEEGGRREEGTTNGWDGDWR
jgi:ATP-dependent RNA helicase DHX57